MPITSCRPPLVVPGRARVGVPAGSSMPGGASGCSSLWPARRPRARPSGSSRQHACSGLQPWRWPRPSWRPAPGRAVPRRPSSRCWWARCSCRGASRGRRWHSSGGTRRRRCWALTGASPSARPSSTPAISGRCAGIPGRDDGAGVVANRAVARAGEALLRAGEPGRPFRCSSGARGPGEGRSCSRTGRRPGRPWVTSAGAQADLHTLMVRYPRSQAAIDADAELRARPRRWRSPSMSGCSGPGSSWRPGTRRWPWPSWTAARPTGWCETWVPGGRGAAPAQAFFALNRVQDAEEALAVAAAGLLRPRRRRCWCVPGAC